MEIEMDERTLIRLRQLVDVEKVEAEMLDLLRFWQLGGGEGPLCARPEYGIGEGDWSDFLLEELSALLISGRWEMTLARPFELPQAGRQRLLSLVPDLY